MPVIDLHFAGPYPLCSEQVDVLDGCPQPDAGGLYLWTVINKELGFLVSYVGETGRSFYYRNKEHVIQVLGGNYEILDPAALTRGSRHRVWPGLWRKDTRDKLPEFLSAYGSLASTTKEYLFLQQVFVGVLDCEPRLRRRIEGALAAAFLAQPHHLLPGDVRYYTRRESETPVDVAVTTDRKIAGLPSRLSG